MPHLTYKKLFMALLLSLSSVCFQTTFCITQIRTTLVATLQSQARELTQTADDMQRSLDKLKKQAKSLLAQSKTVQDTAWISAFQYQAQALEQVANRIQGEVNSLREQAASLLTEAQRLQSQELQPPSSLLTPNHVQAAKLEAQAADLEKRAHDIENSGGHPMNYWSSCNTLLNQAAKLRAQAKKLRGH